MATTQKPQSAAAAPRAIGWWSRLPIGRRLIAGYLAIIVLIGLTGFLAVNQLRSLTDTTTELNRRDLPEVAIVGSLRTLLFRQRDLEERLASGQSTNEAGDQAALTAILDQIANQRAVLLTFEPPDPASAVPNDTPLVEQFASGLLRSAATAKQVQALVGSGSLQEAQALEQSQQAPLLQSLLDATAQLRDMEQKEAAASAEAVQQQSRQATWVILALTLFSLPLSILLAVLITRSLTKPLSSLVHATEAMTAGNLEEDPRIARGDELGQLATAFNSMRLNLRSTIATLAMERQQTQAIIDASADGVMLVDAQRVILEVNPAAERLSGWPRSEALGRHCWEVLGCLGAESGEAEDHERLCPLTRALQENSDRSSVEIHAHLRSGEGRWFAVSCAPVSHTEAEPQRVVVGIHDITQLKQVEQLKSDFVAMVSHELRAPLSTVAGSVEMLGLLDPQGDRESYHEVVSILQQQTRRLRQVIEEVLQLTRVDAGRLQAELQPLSLTAFLKAVIDDTRLAWIGDDRPLRLQAPEADLPVWADRALLEIVVRNLLDNARKYSAPDTGIEVKVEPMAAQGRVQLRVCDHGPGIPPDQLDRIFEPFSRGTRSSYNWTRGYGLGLYIAQELIRVQNGEIWAENREEGGACLAFSLCTVAADEPDAAGAEQAKISA